MREELGQSADGPVAGHPIVGEEELPHVCVDEHPCHGFLHEGARAAGGDAVGSKSGQAMGLVGQGAALGASAGGGLDSSQGRGEGKARSHGRVALKRNRVVTF